MSNGHYDAPAYCALCSTPIQTGSLCRPCQEYDPDEVGRALKQDAYDDHLEMQYEDRMSGDQW